MDAWDLAVVADTVGGALTLAAAAVEEEQAVRGIDSLDELALHALFAARLAASGLGVVREERYPADRARARRSEGRRCDLVLTPPGTALPSGRQQLELFAAGRACTLSEALWIEVKTVAQFVEGGANAGYSGALQGPVWRDVRKLASDEEIRHAAVLLVLFTADREVADHDLGAWAALGRGRGLCIAEPECRRVALSSRLGNGLCTAALFRVGG